jgi:hypothetical protein
MKSICFLLSICNFFFIFHSKKSFSSSQEAPKVAASQEAPKVSDSVEKPAKKQDGLKPPETLFEVNSYMNRGYSMLTDQSSFLEQPSSVLSKYDIFDYKMDVDKMLNSLTTPNYLIFEHTPNKLKRHQKIFKEYSTEEIKKNQDFIITGDYQISNNNFFYERAKSVKSLHKKKTILYYHEKVDFTIRANNKTQFPVLSGVFLADALEIFNVPEVSKFEDQDQYVSQGLAFLYKYGTHYLKSAKFGSRVSILTELRMSKEDLNTPSNQTNKYESNIRSGSIQLEQSVDKKGIRYTDFDQSMEIGNCRVDTFKNEFHNCAKEVSKFGLLGYEVDYLYNVFNQASIVGGIKLPDGSQLTPDKLENMYKNLKNFITAVEKSMDIRNSVIGNLVIYNNLSNEDKGYVGCVSTDLKTKRFGSFPGSLFSEEHKIGRLQPMFRLSGKNQVNFYEFKMLGRKKFSTYACMLKKFPLTLDDMFSSKLLNGRWIKDIKLFTNSTLSAGLKQEKLKPEDCMVLWGGNGRDGDPKKVLVDYLCPKYTTDFLDNKLITDFKVKQFSDDKCSKFKYNDREYECNCDINLAAIPHLGSKNKRYLCYSRKS